MSEVPRIFTNSAECEKHVEGIHSPRQPTSDIKPTSCKQSTELVDVRRDALCRFWHADGDELVTTVKQARLKQAITAAQVIYSQLKPT